jgi:putative hemolysin
MFEQLTPNMSENKLIDTTHFILVSPIFEGERGQRFARFVMKLFKIDLVNDLYEHSSQYKGAEFAASILKDLGVDYLIGYTEKLMPLREGVFITVSNHAYGGLDGIMLIDLMATIRSDYKLMVNEILSLVKNMEENIISVQPRRGNKSPDPVKNIFGIRETLAHIKDGHPLGFFPAGAVSMFNFKNFRIRDREWQESIIKLIQTLKVPIVPIRFFDKNSIFFYLLGLIDWRVRQFRMPYELFNKKKRKIRIGIGDIISVDEQAKFPDAKSLGAYLHKVIYAMPLPESFIARSEININISTGNSKDRNQ